MEGAAGENFKKQLEALKPLLSVETVNVLQLFGFNFRQGIGAPLTNRAKDAIEGQKDVGSELQLESIRHQRAAMELARTLRHLIAFASSSRGARYSRAASRGFDYE